MESQRGRGRRADCFWTASAVSIALLLLGATAPLDAGARLEDSGSLNPFVRGALEKALSDALARVEGDRCRQIFLDFKDAQGRSLASVLDDLHVTARGYLSAVHFASGKAYRPCGNQRVAAFTYPHTGTIYLCELFAVLARLNPRLGAAIVLHETLHTLGLPENPPSSAEITQGVLERCGG